LNPGNGEKKKVVPSRTVRERVDARASGKGGHVMPGEVAIADGTGEGNLPSRSRKRGEENVYTSEKKGKKGGIL